MPKEKMAVKFEKPPVHFSKFGAPYILVEDIFHSEEGQKVISRMATIGVLSKDRKNGHSPIESDSE